MENYNRRPAVPAGGPRLASTALRWSIAVAALAYIAYLALLVTCDLWRVEPLGFVPRFESGAVTISEVQPGSIGARAGLQPGDRIKRANTQILQGGADWQRVRVYLDPSKPLKLEIEHDGRSSTVTLLLSSGLGGWRSGPPRPGLVAFRLAQIVTLGFALVVALKCSLQPSALLGALLLASIATLSISLPMRIVAFWQLLPWPLSLLLWVPFTTSVAVGPLLFAFFAVFPRQRWSRSRLALALAPAVLTVGWYLYAWYAITRDLGPPTGLPDWVMPVFSVNVAYAGVAVALLVVHRRAAETLTDQRRIRALIVGAVLGLAAGIGVVFGYWRNPGADIFATRTTTALSLVFLAMPASFAYAILRHRLFDVSLLVRQGLRYALARRFVDALIPMLGTLVLVDVLMHREQSIGPMLQSRWWWFTLVGAALFVVRSHREDWLEGVDRRFFRERYDAQRLLRNIADQVTNASQFDDIAPAVIQQIDEALHPVFVSVLRHVAAESMFSAVQTGSSADRVTGPLPASLAVVGVLSVLRKPLALSLGDTAWVRHQLPLEERALLVARGIELLVPISSRFPSAVPLGLIVLGPRRSEDPYNQEDLDLLVTIAQAVGALLERSSGDRYALAECDRCGRCFDAGASVCADDGQPLTTAHGSRLLNDRYRLERRLGRGGMGTVYSAMDDVLERPVAVKVIREDAVGPLDLVSRFRREARAAAGFAHPHVVRVYDFGVDRNRRPFLVMELLEGETLRQRLASPTSFSTAEVLHILRGVCAALSAAHGRGLVHRDLKPENIFLQSHPSGVVPKVLDFGLAKALNAQASLHQSTAASSAGILVGTLEYMAPEQAAGGDVSPGWDIWAVAVMTYEMLTGSHPFRRTVAFSGDSTMADVAASTRGSSELPDTILAFFRTALSTEPALRPGRAADFLTSFEQALR